MSKDKYPCIFLKPNGGYCVYYPSNIFSRGCILRDLFLKVLNVKVILSALKILLVCSKWFVVLILKNFLGIKTKRAHINRKVQKLGNITWGISSDIPQF